LLQKLGISLLFYYNIRLMNILIVSDLHLDNFNAKTYSFLKNLISTHDQVIINGDFWSYLASDFDDFIKSKWSQLFPLLLEKNTIYIYGNHDLKKWCDERVNLFSKEQHDNYVLEINGIKYIIEHGHRIVPDKIASSDPYIKLMKFIHYERLVRDLAGWLIFHTGKLAFLNLIGYSMHKTLVNYAKKNYKTDTFIVAGHTHHAVYMPEINLIDTGFISSGLAQYLEIKDGSPKLVITEY
jgi:predicted phosphodiesterase